MQQGFLLEGNHGFMLNNVKEQNKLYLISLQVSIILHHGFPMMHKEYLNLIQLNNNRMIQFSIK